MLEDPTRRERVSFRDGGIEQSLQRGKGIESPMR